MGCHHVWGAPIAARQACPLQEPRTPPAWAGTLAQRRLETQLLHGAYPTYRLVNGYKPTKHTYSWLKLVINPISHYIWRFPKMGDPPKPWFSIRKWSTDLYDLGVRPWNGNFNVGFASKRGDFTCSTVILHGNIWIFYHILPYSSIFYQHTLTIVVIFPAHMEL